ncbi:hypothetical protein JCM9534A_27780 [Catenuloplanes indicus JCM 9534]
MTNGDVRNNPACRVIFVAAHSRVRDRPRPGVGNLPKSREPTEVGKGSARGDHPFVGWGRDCFRDLRYVVALLTNSVSGAGPRARLALGSSLSAEGGESGASCPIVMLSVITSELSHQRLDPPPANI